ncbi:MAG: DUF2752 domain-containing protein [Lachnospiraceae bacterium]|nr:DUF2752 domain-containing protein [Lachnospiraceae bacterium]
MREIGKRIGKDIKSLWLAAVAIVLYTVLMNLIFDAFCPMIILTGLPCPGCGMTRALFYLMRGNVAESVRMHPMGIPIAGLGFYFCWNRYVKGRWAKGMNIFMGIAIVMLVICYVWRMWLFFPDRTPYVYTPENALARILPVYEHLLHEWGIL